MAKSNKIVLIKSCVVKEAGEGKKAKPFEVLSEVSVSAVDARFLIACGNAADPSTEEGKELIAAAKAAQPKKAAKK